MPDLVLLVTSAAALGIGVFAGWSWAQRRFGVERERWEDALQRSIDEARTDPLTGLWNRRAFDEQLAIQTAVAERYGVPCALVLIDVDSLKSVNDRAGHEAGDGALRQLADLLRSNLRAADLAMRVGGDEFALILPQTDLAGAKFVAERLLARSQARQDQTTVGSNPFELRVSLGVAAHSREESTTDLRTRADRALYQAKQAGGDRVCTDEGGQTTGDQRSIDRSSL